LKRKKITSGRGRRSKGGVEGGHSCHGRGRVGQDWRDTGGVIEGKRFNRNKAFKIEPKGLCW